MLNYVLGRDTVFIIKNSEFDKWGQPTGAARIEIPNCKVKGSESLTPVEGAGGRQTLPTYSISVNGDVAAATGDKIEINGESFYVLRKSTSKDLYGKVLITKLTV